MLRDDIGHMLKQARLRRGLTLRAFSDQIGVPFSTIGFAEQGGNISVDRLEQFASALGVRIEFAVADEPTGPQLTAEHRAVIDRMTRILPSQPPGETYVFDAILDAMERRKGASR